MIIGIPKETKTGEGRVALLPSAVRQLVTLGHQVRLETQAGWLAGFSDEDYAGAGATITGVAEAWCSDLVVKVKEPLPEEYGYLGRQMLFTFLHLSGVDRELTETLLAQRTTALGYETLEDSQGGLPLLAPMSAIAGNMATQVGAHYLAKTLGGRGTQLGQVLGVSHGQVVILGDGTVAQHAASTALGLGAQVLLIGLDEGKVSFLSARYGDRFRFVKAAQMSLDEVLPDTDLLIGAVLQKGARADSIVKHSHVKMMPKGSVIVDVSIDQGGCVETSHATSHDNPIFEVDGVIHYAVSNMPGAYPRTATVALSEVVRPFVVALAQEGLDALAKDQGFAKSLQTLNGKIRLASVAHDLGLSGLYDPNPFLAE